jgi:hypothetical protein
LSFEKVFLIYERKLCLEETKDFKVLLLCASSASDKVEIITGHNKASSLLEALGHKSKDCGDLRTRLAV